MLRWALRFMGGIVYATRAVRLDPDQPDGVCARSHNSVKPNLIRSFEVKHKTGITSVPIQLGFPRRAASWTP